MTDIEDQNGEVAASHFILQCTKKLPDQFRFRNRPVGHGSSIPDIGNKKEYQNETYS
jgi:hypothetical protein